MTLPEALNAAFRDNERILLEDADPQDACGFVRTDGPAGGFFWCVCAEECRCSHCKDKAWEDE